MCKRLFYLVPFAMVMGLVLTNAAQGADPNLVAWWRLDDGAGDIAVDSSGNGHNGTLTNAQWVAPGWDAAGSCVELDRDGHVDLGNPDALNFGNVDWTVAAWINTTITGTAETERGTIFANGGDWGGGVRFTLCVAEQEDGMVTLTCDDDSTKVQAMGTTAVNDGQWHFVAGQREGTTVRVYIDAVAEGENTVPATYNLSGTSQHNAYLGAITDHRDASLKKTYAGLLDDVRIFNRALSADELVLVMMDAGDPELAANPSPEDKAVDVPRDVALSWTAGEFAATHDVYLGTAFDDVNDADRANSLGVLVSEGQADATYAPPAVLEYGQTYYWRIDEVNAAPDSTVFRGDLWSFTVEPLAYEIEGVLATSNAPSDEGVGPDRTVDSSGLNENAEHSTEAGDMWLGKAAGADPVYIQYQFDRLYKMHELLVWNYNVMFEPVLGFGLKDVTVEYSTDGAEWLVLGDVEFAQATATADYVANTTVDLAGVAARYVRLTVNSGHGVLPQFGLSEVRFLQIPAVAREPQPAPGAADVSVDSVLSWRAGRDAAAHDVYFAAGQDELMLVDTVTDSAFAPGELTFGTTYTWRIDEVNEAEATPVWEGDLWTFATQEYAVIDDFESYDDQDNRIYDTWLDGFVNDSGSTVGYFEAPFAEQTIVNSGGQSMPLEYDNSVAPFYSEAERDLGSQDWTANGADTLRLFLRGNPVAFVERADGSIVIGGAGADIWGTADEFRYAYKQLGGDGEIVARVDSLVDTDAWAKVGVMIRQTLDADSPFAAVYITPGNGCRFQARTASGIDAVSDTSVATPEQTAIAAPQWVKIVRTGDQFSGFYSADGATWTAMAWNPQNIPMVSNALIGLAVTSHNANSATNAEFSGVATAGGVTGSWQTEAIGVEMPSNDPDQLYVAIEDTAGNLQVVVHPDPAAVGAADWQEWPIPFSELSGVNLSRVAVMYIGVGDRDNPSAAGTGILYIDDIGFGHPAAAE